MHALDAVSVCTPRPSQLAILAALNDHLRDELDASGKKHSQALGDILSRLHVLQTEAEQQQQQQQRAQQEAGTSGPQVMTPEFIRVSVLCL